MAQYNEKKNGKSQVLLSQAHLPFLLSFFNTCTQVSTVVQNPGFWVLNYQDDFQWDCVSVSHLQQLLETLSYLYLSTYIWVIFCFFSSSFLCLGTFFLMQPILGIENHRKRAGCILYTRDQLLVL